VIRVCALCKLSSIVNIAFDQHWYSRRLSTEGIVYLCQYQGVWSSLLHLLGQLFVRLLTGFYARESNI
jgi:hypothetical protein